MIEQLSTFPDNVLAFVGRGQVTRADYDAVLVPAVEKALARHDFKVGMERLTRWERIAVVTDVE
ncbi:MAG: STAS/SEC14 domain-containing protein [Steroidobacteraceae bacterium]